MKLINICLIVFAVIAAVNAQFDEKEFQLKRAQNYIFQREYTKANEIYQELLEQFPEDHEIAARLITNLIRISELDKAEQILEKYKKIFPDLQFVTTSIVLYTALGDPETAGKIASDYIEKNPGKIAAYREISVAFEKVRNYEKSIEVMLKARKSARDDYLYTRELALAYEMIEDLSNSSKEYLKHLEYNQSYFHFVFSRMKKILAVSPVQIENIRNYTQNSDNESILELYALCLGEIGDTAKALEIYEKLEPVKLLEFADRQRATGNMEIALTAYSKYLENIDEPHLKADVLIELAEIKIEQKDFSTAKQILLEIYADDQLNKGKYFYKTNAGRICRELLAEIAQREYEPDDIILAYLEEAKDFAFNQKIRKEIDYKILHFQVMSNKLDQAKADLKNLLLNDDSGTDTYKLGLFYSFFISGIENDPAADSLLGELLVFTPSGDLTNDALELKIIGDALTPAARRTLFHAYQQKNLYRFAAAIDSLMTIHDLTGNEDVLILAGTWAWQAEDNLTASSIFQLKFENTVLAEYALLAETRLIDDPELRNQRVQNFLKEKPESVFSPEFRQLLE